MDVYINKKFKFGVWIIIDFVYVRTYLMSLCIWHFECKIGEEDIWYMQKEKRSVANLIVSFIITA